MLSLNHLRKKVIDMETKIDRILELLGDQPATEKPVEDDTDQPATEKPKSRKGGNK